MAVFSVAIQSGYKDKSGVSQSVTDFIGCTAWEPYAQVVEKYLRKGTPVVLEGRLKNENYVDKNGVKHYQTKLHVAKIHLLGYAQSGKSGGGGGDDSGGYGGGGYVNNGFDPTKDADIPY